MTDRTGRAPAPGDKFAHPALGVRALTEREVKQGGSDAALRTLRLIDNRKATMATTTTDEFRAQCSTVPLPELERIIEATQRSIDALSDLVEVAHRNGVDTTDARDARAVLSVQVMDLERVRHRELVAMRSDTDDATRALCRRLAEQIPADPGLIAATVRKLEPLIVVYVKRATSPDEEINASVLRDVVESFLQRPTTCSHAGDRFPADPPGYERNLECVDSVWVWVAVDDDEADSAAHALAEFYLDEIGFLKEAQDRRR